MTDDPLADILFGLKREKSDIELTDEMARRVGISHSTGRVILSIARVCARKIGQPVDMVLVAQAMSYAGKNKERLK